MPAFAPLGCCRPSAPHVRQLTHLCVVHACGAVHGKVVPIQQLLHDRLVRQIPTAKGVSGRCSRRILSTVCTLQARCRRKHQSQPKRGQPGLHNLHSPILLGLAGQLRCVKEQHAAAIIMQIPLCSQTRLRAPAVRIMHMVKCQQRVIIQLHAKALAEAAEVLKVDLPAQNSQHSIARHSRSARKP